MRRLWGWLAGLLLVTTGALAHKPSDSYLMLRVEAPSGGAAGMTGQWDIALRDLDVVLGLDADGDGQITWGEVRTRHAEIAAFALARLQVQADGLPCTVTAGAQQVDEHTDGAYTVIPLQLRCAQPVTDSLTVGYTLFADVDPQHRGLLNLATPGGTRTAVMGPQAATQTFTVGAAAEAGPLAQFITYVREGVWHIWIGFDHILFLLSLLLPAVGTWQKQPAGRVRWQPVQRLREAVWDVLRIVTAFTVAHSITLSLATLGLVSLPSRLVESVIAASVVLAALNNVWPLFQGRRWSMAFAFGLIHGFGFASVLADLGLPQDALALALVGFNVGVELGQLAIVVAFLPLAFVLRDSAFYRRAVLVAGSLLIAAIALAWFLERAFQIPVFPA
jgi:HupE / UreJ protein